MLFTSGCNHSRLISPEAFLFSPQAVSVPEVGTAKPQLLAAQQAQSETQGSNPVILVKDDKDNKKDCEAMEVDQDGKPVKDTTGKKHWYCGKVPNGVGGYMCHASYLGVKGCNNCAACSCQNVGAGATQNCMCK
jgi:hypothetical protein